MLHQSGRTPLCEQVLDLIQGGRLAERGAREARAAHHAHERDAQDLWRESVVGAVSEGSQCKDAAVEERQLPRAHQRFVDLVADFSRHERLRVGVQPQQLDARGGRGGLHRLVAVEHVQQRHA
jgi:hypothetical protein